ICPSTTTSVVWPRCTATGVVWVIIGYDVCPWATLQRFAAARRQREKQKRCRPGYRRMRLLSFCLETPRQTTAAVVPGRAVACGASTRLGMGRHKKLKGGGAPPPSKVSRRTPRGTLHLLNTGGVSVSPRAAFATASALSAAFHTNSGETGCPDIRQTPS